MSTEALQIIAAPSGYEFIEAELTTEGDLYSFQGTVIGWVAEPDAGLIPLGIGERPDEAAIFRRAIICPNGRIEERGRRWDSIAAFLADREAELRAETEMT